jgi:hypothetical protein
MGTVAQDIRGAQETAHATERMSADVVEAAAVIDEQTEQLREKLGHFVIQLRNAGSLATSRAKVEKIEPEAGEPQLRHAMAS